MAINNENQFENTGGSIGTNNPVIDTSKYVFFKDIQPEIPDWAVDAGDDVDIAALELVLQEMGFEGLGKESSIGVWAIKEITGKGLCLEWTGELSIKYKNLIVDGIKFKDYSHATYQFCAETLSDGSLYLNTGATDLGNNRYRVYLSELGLCIEKDNSFYWNDMKWTPKSLIPPHSWVQKNEIDKSFDVTPSSVYSGFPYGNYFVFSNMLNNKVCGEIEIPAFYIKNGEKYEKLKGYSWTTARNDDIGFPQYKIDNMKINTTKGPFSWHSLRGGYVPIIIKTNTSEYGREGLSWTLSFSDNKLMITDDLSGVEVHNFDPNFDKLFCYVRPCGSYGLTQGIPIAIDYYKDSYINKDKIKAAGYFTLSDETRGDDTPWCCLIGKDDKVVEATGTLKFKKVSEGGMHVYEITKNCTITNKGMSTSGDIIKWNVSGFPFANRNKNTDMWNSIITTAPTFDVTFPALKNVADFASDKNRARISDGTGFNGDTFNSISRLKYGFQLKVNVQNMPYIHVPTSSLTFDWDYTEADNIKVAGDVYAYCDVDRHFNMFHYFNVVLSADFKATPGMFPRSMNIDDSVTKIPIYKESSEKYVVTSGMRAPVGTNCDGKDYENTETVLDNTWQYYTEYWVSWHTARGTFDHSLHWFTKIGYFSEYVDYNSQTGLYLVLWKRLDYPVSN